MTTCGGDYLNISWISRSYVIMYAVMCYFVPLGIIVYSYYYIVKVGLFVQLLAKTKSHMNSL